MKSKSKLAAGSKVGRSVIRSLKEIRAWQQRAYRRRARSDPPVRIKAIRKKTAKSIRIFSERFGLPAKRPAIGARRATARRRKLTAAGGD